MGFLLQPTISLPDPIPLSGPTQRNKFAVITWTLERVINRMWMGTSAVHPACVAGHAVNFIQNVAGENLSCLAAPTANYRSVGKSARIRKRSFEFCKKTVESVFIFLEKIARILGGDFYLFGPVKCIGFR